MYINSKYINEVAEFTNPNENWGTWRIKNEIRRDYSKSADVPIKDNYIRGDNLSEWSNAPPISDPICRYKTIYLNGCGGSGKTTRAIELYRTRANIIVLTLTQTSERDKTTKRRCMYLSQIFSL